MSVGGHLIEIKPMVNTDPDNRAYRRDVVRLWVMDQRSGDETCVYVEPTDDLPALGEQVWWQSGKVYFDNDRRHLTKVGYSFSAPGSR